jgi:hypothetical protein
VTPAVVIGMIAALATIVTTVVTAAVKIARAYGREEAARAACEKTVDEMRATTARFGARLQILERDLDRRRAVAEDREVTGRRPIPQPPRGGHGG